MTNTQEKIDLVVTLTRAERFNDLDAIKRDLYTVTYPESVMELVEGAIILKQKRDDTYTGIDLKRALTAKALETMDNAAILDCITSGSDDELTPELINRIAAGEFEDDDKYLEIIPTYFFPINDYLRISIAMQIIEDITGYKVGRSPESPWVWMVYKNKQFAEDFVGEKNFYTISFREVDEEGQLGSVVHSTNLFHAPSEDYLEIYVKDYADGKEYRYEKNEITEKMLLPRVEVEKETRYRI